MHPDGQDDSATSDSLERILREATVLFAEHGYHGLSMRTLSKAVGLNISTINYHAGSKKELYHQIFQRLFVREFEVVSSLVGDVEDAVVEDAVALRDLLTGLIDALIDMSLEKPEVPRLWVRRWLQRGFQFDDIEVNYSLPLYEMVRDLLQRARQAGTLPADGPDTRLLLISFTWILYGYFTGGPIPWNMAKVDPYQPEEIAAFRTFMHGYVCRMLGL